MQFPPELKMRPFSPERPDGADEWRPFDHRLRLTLAGLLRGGWTGARSGFAAIALVWIGHLLFTPRGAGWGADLAAMSLIGGIIGSMSGAALGMALVDEE